MTGRYQVRSGIYPDVLRADDIGGASTMWFITCLILQDHTHTHTLLYIIPSFSLQGLPHNETTVAELVKSVGYSTAHIGKWHLGIGENFQYLPTTQGFDYYLVSVCQSIN